MALIQTATERMAEKAGLKIVIFGPSGIGKTSLVWTLDPDKTLVVDMEAGMLALEGWKGGSINVREQSVKMGLHPWQFLQNLTCLISGPNPSVLETNKVYSQAHYDHVISTFGSRKDLIGKYDTIFFDSITQTGRLAFSWAKTQPEAFSEKTGKPDNRGAYGLLGQEMVGGSGLLSHLQHCPDKNIILVGILEKKVDDYGRTTWQAQIDGGKTGNELPGIVDEVISMVEMPFGDPPVKHRVFVCQTLNPEGYPAKDRSGRLDMIEEPHLGKLIAKMTAGRRSSEMTYGMPSQEPTPSPPPPNPVLEYVKSVATAEAAALPGETVDPAKGSVSPEETVASITDGSSDIPWMQNK